MPESLQVHSELRDAVDQADVILLAVPTSAVGDVSEMVAAASIPERCAVLGTAKGLEAGSGRRLSEVMAEQLGAERRQAQLLRIASIDATN